MWSLLFSLIPGLFSSVTNYLSKRSDNELRGFETGTGADTERYGAWLRANSEANALKAATNGWWGAKLIILMAGIPAAGHMALIFLDTMIPPFGNWGTPRLPPPYDGYEKDIVLSFFIITPAMPVVSAAALWLGRRR